MRRCNAADHARAKERKIGVCAQELTAAGHKELATLEQRQEQRLHLDGRGVHVLQDEPVSREHRAHQDAGHPLELARDLAHNVGAEQQLGVTLRGQMHARERTRRHVHGVCERGEQRRLARAAHTLEQHGAPSAQSERDVGEVPLRTRRVHPRRRRQGGGGGRSGDGGARREHNTRDTR